MYSFIGGVIRNRRCVLMAAGGMPDHVHLLVSLNPTIALADLIRDMKANSSGWLKENHVDLAGFGWQGGYGAFGVSQSNIEVVREYLGKQEEHHRKLSFREEYIRLLEKHGVEHDPRYVLTDE